MMSDDHGNNYGNYLLRVEASFNQYTVTIYSALCSARNIITKT